MSCIKNDIIEYSYASQICWIITKAAAVVCCLLTTSALHYDFLGHQIPAFLAKMQPYTDPVWSCGLIGGIPCFVCLVFPIFCLVNSKLEKQHRKDFDGTSKSRIRAETVFYEHSHSAVGSDELRIIINPQDYERRVSNIYFNSLTGWSR